MYINCMIRGPQHCTFPHETAQLQNYTLAVSLYLNGLSLGAFFSLFFFFFFKTRNRADANNTKYRFYSI